MSEGFLVLMSIAKGLGLIACAFLYTIGGGVDNWKGNWKWCRVVSPFLASVVIFVTCGFNWWVLLYGPLLWAALTVSYGDNSNIRLFWGWALNKSRFTLEVKIVTRMTCGFVWGLPAWILVFFGGDPLVCMFYHMFLVWISMAEELFNLPAIPEQFMRGMAILWMPIFMIY